MGFLEIFRDRKVAAAIIVAALGYFVDVFDLLLFSTVRVSSLSSLGLSGEALTDAGVQILNAQLIGLLIGGIIFGVYGDKKGRLSVLFGSIFIYSVANILNAFVDSVPAYIVLRFVAGLGLAGELGAGITLVSELLPKEQRGYGTTLVAAVGVTGAIFAGLAGENMNWRNAYLLGGVLGFLLLFLRVAVSESGIFQAIASSDVQKGNLLMIFQTKERKLRYLSSILIGIPIWFFVGVLIAFCPEIGRDLALTGAVTTGNAIIFAYVGLALGDVASGLLSQHLQSRKKAIGIFLGMTSLVSLLLLHLREISPGEFYSLLFIGGFFAGYWAVFVSAAAEQFGTNLRATVATTVPNFVRGTAALMTTIFGFLKPTLGAARAAETVGMIALIVSLVGFKMMKETFGRELNFLEEDHQQLS
jgi:putative MFS transporter